MSDLFREVGLYNPKNQFYATRSHKHQQVFSYITQIVSALRKLSAKRPIVFLDCGCGKSYLSFVLYHYCKTVLHRNIKIIGVDNNATLIQKCQSVADALGFQSMQFYHTPIDLFNSDEKIYVVYSLHACDTATDQTIAKGVNECAKYIFSVSCCQHTHRRQIKRHPLTKISQHKPYKERLVDMVGDSMRALILEHLNYGVHIFEFTAAQYTPKNIMLRAIRDTAKKQDREVAFKRYQQLVDMFHFAPALETLIIP